MVTINQRHFSTSLSLQEELNFDAVSNYICDLSNHAVLEVAGSKAIEFLQGQLTCNLDDLTPETICQGALCNLKGRIVALMDVVLWHGRVFLILPKDLLDTIQLTLSKIAMFSRVTLVPQPDIKPYGLLIQTPQPNQTLFDIQPQSHLQLSTLDKHCCYRLTNSMTMLLTTEPESILPPPDTTINAKKTSSVSLLPKNEEKAPEGRMRESLGEVLDRCLPSSLVCSNMNDIRKGPLLWHALGVQAGVISIYPNSRGLFLPHHLGLHRTHYISFHKGCYKGQEIIARMQYRAKIKHSMQLVSVTTRESLFAGQKILADDSQREIGEVIDHCPYGHNLYQVLISTTQPDTKYVNFESHQIICELNSIWPKDN